MLQDIRDNSQGVVVKIMIGVMVAAFAMLGVDSIIGAFVSIPPVAEINGEEVTEQQLESSTQNLLASIGGNADAFDNGLLQQIALNQLIEEIMLQQAADNASMLVSNNRIDNAILESPQFQLNGVFDSDLAIRTMFSQGFTVERYRDNLQQRLLMSQIANAYSASNFATESEIERLVSLSEQTRDFRYLSIPLGTRTLGNAISDAEIEAYYTANEQDFMLDETVTVQYVMLDKNLISAELNVEESRIRQQYETERDSFEGASEKRASHILFEVVGSTNEAQALEMALAAKLRLDDGEDFATVALDVSTDTFSAQQGGDIGYSDGSAFPDAVEEALLSLNVDEVSAPVVSEFGVHLVMLTEDAENVFQSYEDVSARIENELKSSQVELLFSERLEDLSNLAFESADLASLSEQLGLEIQLSDAIPRAGGRGVFSNPALVGQAFSDEVLLNGNNSDVIEINETQAVVLRTLEHTLASVEALDEVKPEIAVIIRTQMETDAVQQLGEELLEKMQGGDDISNLLSTNDLGWINEATASRDSPAVNREVLNKVFALAKPSGSSEIAMTTLANGTYVLIELNAVIAGEISNLEDGEQDSMSASLVQQLGTRDFQGFINNFRENSDIRSNILEGF
ncbi:MAG: hypothetical protein COC19_00555 [SAR86 cluster bacterium]|uniref:Periplasmic chaperone PpiD n=1 Tax=SAR86 cluster bacterium TaxID=2030880 RepID=A0A2A4MVE5_9GAMM|nr:MAG: hypothetical protein COC19_00555 [SAR86 cluster bacterium]